MSVAPLILTCNPPPLRIQGPPAAPAPQGNCIWEGEPPCEPGFPEGTRDSGPLKRPRRWDRRLGRSLALPLGAICNRPGVGCRNGPSRFDKKSGGVLQLWAACV